MQTESGNMPCLLLIRLKALADQEYAIYFRANCIILTRSYLHFTTNEAT